MGIHDKIKSHFCSDKSTSVNQITIAFTMGLLFGPFANGLVFRIVFLVIYEVIVFYFTAGLAPYWKIRTRVGVIIAGLCGYFLGRWLILCHYSIPVFKWY
jgi:hypothetical protein